MEVSKSAKQGQRRRLWQRRAPWVVLGVICFLTVGYTFLSYLSNLPRERFARGYKFLERAWLGAETASRMTALKLAAHHEDPKNTQLPIVEIYIRGKRHDRLVEALPNTGADFEKMKIQLEGKSYSGLARFKGDSVNHWAYPNRSWRVQLKDDDSYRGMRVFNLNVPRVRTQLSNWLGYELAQSFNSLAVPLAKNVHFRLNRQFDGVRLLLEQPTQDFLIRQFFPPGKIFVGDISSDQIYGNVPRKHLYSDPTGWFVRAPGNDSELREMQSLIKIITKEHNPYRFYDSMRSLVDMDALTNYMALLELVGSVHVDETHNGKFYFNPHTGKFIPIVWDTVAYFWGNKMGFDIGANRLFRVVLSNPEFRSKKDRALWQAMNGHLSTDRIIEKILREKERVGRDLYAFPFKLHANDKGLRHISNQEWETAVRDLVKIVKEREGKFRNHITPTDLQFGVDADGSDTGEVRLGIQVASAAGVVLDEVRVADKTLRSGVLRRVGIEDARRTESQPNRSSFQVAADKKSINGENTLVFPLGDKLYSKRKFVKRGQPEIVPATYVYSLSLPGAAKDDLQIELIGKNTITGESVRVVQPTEGLSVPEQHTPLKMWWSPDQFREGKHEQWRGRVELRETRTFGPGDSLVIEPGTVVRFGKGVSLVLDEAKLAINGEAALPVKFEAINPAEPWGSLALRNVTDGVINYASFSGASYDHIDHVRYEGAIAVHGGEVKGSHLTVDGVYLSAKSGRLLLSDTEFKTPFPFTVKGENAVVRERNSKQTQTPLVHSVGLLKGEGAGTPTRIEREFKFSIVGSDVQERDLMDVAKDIRKALEKRVSKDSAESALRWAAPEKVGAKYYVDDKAEDFLFRDIYFDTQDDLNYKHQISYRYRNRYKGWRQYKDHVKNQSLPELWPYRLEFQAKVGREELGDGFSNVKEARFEFREASLPFSADHLPPDSPWNEEEFLTYFQSGRFHGTATYPAQAVMETLKADVPASGELEFLPRLVLVTERFRQHLNIPSEYGSGPNPEQSFIISLDKTRVYEAPQYLKYLKDMKEEIKYTRKPNSVGSLLEMEVEFERNVSDVLDRKITEITDPVELEKLTEIRDAFLSDQQTIMKVVDEELRKKGLGAVPANKSKYVQAFELASLGWKR